MQPLTPRPRGADYRFAITPVRQGRRRRVCETQRPRDGSIGWDVRRVLDHSSNASSPQAKPEAHTRARDARRRSRAARDRGSGAARPGRPRRSVPEERRVHPHGRHDEQRARRHAERAVADRRSGDELQQGVRVLSPLLPLSRDDDERALHAQPRGARQLRAERRLAEVPARTNPTTWRSGCTTTATTTSTSAST